MRTHRIMKLEVLTVSLAVFLVVLLQQGQTVVSFGYSYSRFIGPVRGPERQIIVHDRYDGRGRVDYVARPEYQFAYGVEDAKTRVLQNRRETRNGDAVKGVYSVVDPDGSLRVVKYTADNANGFQAEVISNGVSRIHGQDNPVVHPPQSVVAVGDGNQVNGKDNNNLHHNEQHIQVQHPEDDGANVREEVDGKKTPDVEEEDVEDANEDPSSVSKDANDYEEKEGDGEGAEEQEDASEEEVEDY